MNRVLTSRPYSWRAQVGGLAGEGLQRPAQPVRVAVPAAHFGQVGVAQREEPVQRLAVAFGREA
jgi:hypothetical protein